MSEFQDPLRSLFQQAAGTGQDHAVTAPVDRIAARGRRARRRRIGALVTVACLAFGGGAAVALLPGSSAPVGPAVTPRPSPDRLPSPVPTEPGSSTLPTPESTGSVSPSGHRSGNGYGTTFEHCIEDGHGTAFQHCSRDGHVAALIQLALPTPADRHRAIRRACAHP